MQPKWSKGYSRLGLAKFKAGDLAGAIKAYSSGLAVDPSNTQIADGLAEVRAAGGLAGHGAARGGASVTTQADTTKIRALCPHASARD